MKVVALHGGVDTGKSHVIHIAYQLLLADGWIQVEGHYRELGNPKYEDITDVLEKDGKRLGIVGMGDFVTDGKDFIQSLKSLLKEHEDNECSIALCACRNTKGIENAVKSYREHFFIDKKPQSDRSKYRKVNNDDARALVAKIASLL